MSDVPALTEDQRAVVECDLDARVVVTAGPGTGKTHTLVSRIERLITGDFDISGQEVLSLSFSRAAVGELRRRVSTLSGRGSRVRSATFDSFATRLLQTHGDAPLEVADYDQRIVLAINLIDSRPIDELKQIRHILIDEAQDLTGIRAELVLKLLSMTNSGFTIFADQAQAIYDFANPVLDAQTFLDRVTAKYGDTVKALQLNINHRTTDGQLLAISALGDLIRAADADHTEVINKFDRAHLGLPSAGSIDDAAFMLQGARDVAVLTRRNNEALAVSAVLYQSGVTHQLRRRADDPVVGSWLGRLRRAVDNRRMTLDDLHQWTSLLPWSPDVTWAALSRAARPRKGILDFNALEDQLSERLPPDELVDNGTDGVVVSTIHRAKGLEFDTVLLVPFDIDDDDWLPEARVLYVGLTRAKHNLMAVKAVDDRRWGFIQGANRWRRVGFAGKARFTVGIELTGSDSFTFDPTGAQRPRHELDSLSDYLLTSVECGDPVTLEHRAQASDNCVYDVIHNGQWVAATNVRFGQVVTRRLGLKSPPTKIVGCRVESVSTIALAASVAEVLGSTNRLVPNCRIHGVGTWGRSTTSGE